MQGRGRASGYTKGRYTEGNKVESSPRSLLLARPSHPGVGGDILCFCFLFLFFVLPGLVVLFLSFGVFRFGHCGRHGKFGTSHPRECVILGGFRLGGPRRLRVSHQNPQRVDDPCTSRCLSVGVIDAYDYICLSNNACADGCGGTRASGKFACVIGLGKC